jgi:RecJ-like exonuclease
MERGKKYKKTCVKCGKTFIGYSFQTYCHDPCYPIKHIYKTKSHCEICGRFVRSQIPINSSEQLLCSFCLRRENAEKQARKDLEGRSEPKKCRICGKLAHLMPHTRLCKTCYIKQKNPTVLDVREVSL